MARKPAAAGAGLAKKRKDPEAAEASLDTYGFQDTEVQHIRTSLLDWYDRNHRVLPWRRNTLSKLPQGGEPTQFQPAPDGLTQNEFMYRVMVSEVMSQQTQVARAAEKFLLFVARFPTVQDLAGANLEEVNDLWAGLGYYRRARFLLEGAKYVVEKLRGEFPTTARELQKIPGVGPYTSAAIASISCGERIPVVDGNVIRVIARLRAVDAAPNSGVAIKLWARLGAELLDEQRPGDFNQAMMELGAMVCVPNTQPDCTSCPINASCTAYRQVQLHSAKPRSSAGPPRVTDYPAKVVKAEKRPETVAVAVVTATDSAGKDWYLLSQRPLGNGLLAGMWEAPQVPVPASATRDEQQAAIDAHLGQLLRGEDGEGEAPSPSVLERRQLGECSHTFSHIALTMKVERVVLQRMVDGSAPGSHQQSPGGIATKWVTESELQTLGLSSGVRKVLALAQKEQQTLRQKKNSITKYFGVKPAATPASETQ